MYAKGPNKKKWKKQILRNKISEKKKKKIKGAICRYPGICSVILVFRSVFQDARELDVVEVALFVDGGLSVQLIHLFIREPVSHRGQQLPQVVFLDEPWNETCREKRKREAEPLSRGS